MPTPSETGLQAERTRLAVTRTALGLLVGALALVRVEGVPRLPAALLLAAVTAGTAAVAVGGHRLAAATRLAALAALTLVLAAAALGSIVS